MGDEVGAHQHSLEKQHKQISYLKNNKKTTTKKQVTHTTIQPCLFLKKIKENFNSEMN